MKVTNQEIKALKFAITVINSKIKKAQGYDTIHESIHHKNHLLGLQKKLFHEFSSNEFPELKEPH